MAAYSVGLLLCYTIWEALEEVALLQSGKFRQTNALSPCQALFNAWQYPADDDETRL